jgi:hypothetical protein
MVRVMVRAGVRVRVGEGEGGDEVRVQEDAATDVRVVL